MNNKINHKQAQLSPEEKRQLLKDMLRAKAEKKELQPLSYSQLSQWFIHQLDPLSAAYNTHFTSRICSTIDPAHIRQAFQQVVTRHVPLRSSYELIENEPQQHVHGNRSLNFELLNSIDLSEDEFEQNLMAQIHQAFDLKDGPVFKVRLYKRGEHDHVLLIVAHHIAVDLWSFVVLMRDFFKFYDAIHNDINIPDLLPKLKYDYLDYIRWQRDYVDGPQGQEAWQYWKMNLAGELPVLNFPTDKPRPTVLTYNGDSLRFLVDQELTIELKELCRKKGLTLYSFLLASFKVLLHRYTSQGDIIVGTPMSGRVKPAFEDIVGMMVNMVPIRSSISGDKNFLNYVHEVQKSVLAALDHQSYPFSLLVEKLHPQHDASHSPLFDISFGLETPQIDPLGIAQLMLAVKNEQLSMPGDLKFETVHSPLQEGQHELSLHMLQTEDSLIGDLSFNKDLFTQESIEQLRDIFIEILQSSLKGTKTRIKNLSYLPKSTFNKLIHEWNQDEAELSKLCLHQLFEEKAKLIPDKTAIIFNGQEISYQEVNNQANHVASHLINLGVKPDELIGIYVPPSVEMIYTLFGILKAGAAYVPLDPKTPEKRLDYIISEGRLKMIITSYKLPQLNTSVACIDINETLNNEIHTYVESQVNNRNLAYIIFTSGSTGKPKGVEIEHRSIVNLIDHVNKSPGITQQDVCLSRVTLNFDLSILEIFGSLCQGATLVLAQDSDRNDGCTLQKLVDKYHITFMATTPSTWKLIYETGFRGHQDLKFEIGAEALNPQVVEQILEHNKSLFNAYGPTEAAIQCSGTMITHKDGPITIGKPLPNIKMYILDKSLSHLPIGVVGEIYVAGPGVGRGYHLRPDLTEERFLTDPFSNTPEARMYKTGDLARYRHDGNIEILGRSDSQIKFRGNRIELGEIESTLMQHDKVYEAVVIPHDFEGNDQRLVAYLISDLASDKKAFNDPLFHQNHFDLQRAPKSVAKHCSCEVKKGPGGFTKLDLVNISTSDMTIKQNHGFALSEYQHLHLKVNLNSSKSFLIEGTCTWANDEEAGINLIIRDDDLSELNDLLERLINNQDMVIHDDRHTKFRLHTHIRCFLTLDTGKKIEITSEDISIDGMVLSGAPASLKKGHQVELGFVLGNQGDNFALTASVVWNHDARMGLRFMIDSAEHKHIQDGLSELIVEQGLTVEHLRDFLKACLPDYMVPTYFVFLDSMPLNANGKIDRKALVKPENLYHVDEADNSQPESEMDQQIAVIWREALKVPSIGLDDNFFDIGGHSLLLAQVCSRLRSSLNLEIPMVLLYQYPTIRALSRELCKDQQEELVQDAIENEPSIEKSTFLEDQAIAVIGWEARLPGCQDIDDFWQKLAAGEELISHFTKGDLLNAGIDEQLLNDANYVRSKAVLENADYFDASFFGYSPRQAERMDPQQRIFLEIAYQALENANCDPKKFAGKIGLFGGMGHQSYLLNNLQTKSNMTDSIEAYQDMINNDKDFLCTRVSYKLGLNGPSINVQSACSTSLVAVHMACQSLKTGQTDLCLAGGVSITSPLKSGYLYQEGSIASPDGHCRAFDAKAQGTVLGNGAGIVALKRYQDALDDGDDILGLIAGSALNNDASDKVGYSAPSVNGQSDVISQALQVAKVKPEQVSYIETHGTATPMGDPIELAALKKAFKGSESACKIGSLKSNLGHLDAAAGIASLIKTLLSLKYKQIPPSLHYTKANPDLGIESSCFEVNTELCPYPEQEGPHYAGVSSFGIGGTNAHVILKELPTREVLEANTDPQILMLSGKSEAGLDSQSMALGNYLKRHTNTRAHDVCYSLAQRPQEAFRQVLVCDNAAHATLLLHQSSSHAVYRASVDSSPTEICWMFSGQGSQYVDMARDLYGSRAVFTKTVKVAAKILSKVMDQDLLTILYPDSNKKLAMNKITQTAIAQPALFTIEYALAQELMSYGLRPSSMIGHSLGEYVCACLAGVMTFEEALILVAHRGRIMQAQEAGKMLSIQLSLEELEGLLYDGLSIAAINGPTSCVVAGPADAIYDFADELESRGIIARALHTSHAFHSYMMNPALEPFRACFKELNLQKPEIPYISNLSGTWIKDEEATNPDYWVEHLRSTVQCSRGLETLLQQGKTLFLELAPGHTMGSLLRQHNMLDSEVFSALPNARSKDSSLSVFLGFLGRLWANGIPLEFEKLFNEGSYQKLALPSKPFNSKRFWVNYVHHEHTERIQKEVVRKSLLEQPNEVYDHISKLWQRELGYKKLNPEDNFFDLGGTSLLAIQLIADIRKEFGLSLSKHFLLEQPTLAGFAKFVTQQTKQMTKSGNDEDHDLLVCLQKGSADSTPLFLIHPVGGTVYLYAQLASCLDKNQTVYGIRSKSTIEENSIEEFATCYLEYVEEICAGGPCYLGGASLGGLIAFEMAQQLLRKNVQVPHIIMVDTYVPGVIQGMDDDAEIAAYLQDMVPDLYESMKNSDDYTLENFIYLFKEHMNICNRYRVTPYDGKVFLFEASDRAYFEGPFAGEGWRPYLSECKTRLMPGNHVSMLLDPHIQKIGKIMMDEILE